MYGIAKGRTMNTEKKFYDVAINPSHPLYEKMIAREKELSVSEFEIRSPFARDYTRILHSSAYRRLKHKTQVFYNIENDHVCTRMEHVLHVESVCYTIAKYLGLNEELTKAIAMGHDLGHAPFGHYGEKVIDSLCDKYLGETFWHERNGLYFVDNIELLPDRNNVMRNLSLTYAVRDGIISHCGEKDINCIKPRSELIDLDDFKLPGQYNPVTFEGCVVKISDKIAYVGRDIEDAISLGFLNFDDLKVLRKIVKLEDGSAVNTSGIISNMIRDICIYSTPENGICLSDETSEILNKIKAFNYKYIYGNERFEAFKKYASLIINELFDVLYSCYNGGDVEDGFNKKIGTYPVIVKEFKDYLKKYSAKAHFLSDGEKSYEKYKNKKIYKDLTDEKVFVRAILDYIAGMTDRYAVDSFNRLTTY